MAAGLKSPASFRVHDGFVYWSTLDAKGHIARCATAGCPDTGPEVLVSDQTYPQHPTVHGDRLFWLTETTANPGDTVERPAYVKGCSLTDCVNDVTVLDRAMGGSRIAPRDIVAQAPALAVDDDTIYYIGDVRSFTQPGGTKFVEGSICRLSRKTAAR